MKKMLSDFAHNMRLYISYIMKVGFGELFLNVGFLLLMIVLSLIVYLPIGIFQDLIRNFIYIFCELSVKVSLLYDWFFALISALLSCFCFIYLFNVKICNGTFMKDAKKDQPNLVKVNNGEKQEEFELPKVAENK